MTSEIQKQWGEWSSRQRAIPKKSIYEEITRLARFGKYWIWTSTWLLFWSHHLSCFFFFFFSERQWKCVCYLEWKVIKWHWNYVYILYIHICIHPSIHPLCWIKSQIAPSVSVLQMNLHIKCVLQNTWSEKRLSFFPLFLQFFINDFPFCFSSLRDTSNLYSGSYKTIIYFEQSSAYIQMTNKMREKKSMRQMSTQFKLRVLVSAWLQNV